MKPSRISLVLKGLSLPPLITHLESEAHSLTLVQPAWFLLERAMVDTRSLSSVQPPSPPYPRLLIELTGKTYLLWGRKGVQKKLSWAQSSFSEPASQTEGAHKLFTAPLCLREARQRARGNEYQLPPTLALGWGGSESKSPYQGPQADSRGL